MTHTSTTTAPAAVEPTSPVARTLVTDHGFTAEEASMLVAGHAGIVEEGQRFGSLPFHVADQIVEAYNASQVSKVAQAAVTAESIQTELVAQSAELLILHRADEVTIDEDAITIARVIIGSPTTAAPRSAREMIHIALADARTQVWRADRERGDDSGLTLIQRLFS